MSVHVEGAALASALSAMKGVVAKGNDIPILATCLVSAGGGKLSVTGTDLDIFTFHTVPCDGELEATSLPLWLLDAGAIKGRDTVIETDGRQAKISSGKARFSGGVLPGSDFPTIAPRFTVSGEIPGAAFASALAYAAPAMLPGSPTLCHNGTNIEAKGGVAVLTAADGHRLLSSSFPCALDIPSITIPARACAEMQSLASSIETLSFEAGETAIAIRAGDRRIVSKLVDTQYPDWRRVVPPAPAAFAAVDVAEANAALARLIRAIEGNLAADRTKARSHCVAVEIRGDDLLLSKPDVASEAIACEAAGQCRPFGVNPAYLRALLTSLSERGAETASIGMTDPSAPVLVSGKDDAVAVVMPMRMPTGWLEADTQAAAA